MDLESYSKRFPVINFDNFKKSNGYCVTMPGNCEEALEDLDQLIKTSLKENEFTRRRRNHLMIEDFVKYPLKPSLQSLENTFVMWYLERPKNREWKDCVKEVGAFQTLQGFFILYNAVSPPSHLRNGHDYMLFKEGVKPMWEDEKNRKGGRWRVSVDVQRKEYLVRTDSYWYELAMAFIRGIFTDDDNVLGIVVNRRIKADKISVWTRDAKNKATNARIGRELRALLDIPTSGNMLYTPHSVQEEGL
ncbi:hypothetical protein QR680_010481 [Steinernema hermaphroditum]|uniref:eIF-4F 25 kDa subunit n=1 Tax=Steinernema hermaphroditum TaxID=289476 RepID=A0AA39MBV7_9BILA|nr:hypothetical protein QR680_010481 [Steinernema hermaphroditum]